jgi:CubicO group peptidase (beta-lactamase class C family)
MAKMRESSPGLWTAALSRRFGFSCAAGKTKAESKRRSPRLCYPVSVSRCHPSWLITSLVLALVYPALSATPQSADTRAIDAIVRDALKAWRVPGAAVAVVRSNEVIYLKGFGVKELGGDEPVTPDTLFPIASCTKAFTTAAMAMLVDEGKMAWDDPVRKHVSYFHLADPLADAQVTLRDLVTHRTGLGSHDLLWYRSPWSREEAIRRIGRAPLKHSFRSTFEYQSTMFTAAGAAVESAAGQKWEDFIKKRIFTPLGMTGAFFTSRAAERADHASPHRENSRGQIEVIPFYPLDHPDPAGSIHAGARDLSQWVRFQLGTGTFNGKRLVSTKNLAETHSPQMIIRLEGQAKDMNPDTHFLNYGMGWVLQDYRGQFLVSHAGAIDGFRVHITLVPDAGLGLVLLNNLHRTQMNLALSNQLVDHLLGLSRRDWNQYMIDQVKKAETIALNRLREREAKRRPGTRPSQDLATYAGTYEDPAYGTATVALVNGGLIWKWSTFTAPLEHFENNTFTVASDLIGRPQLTFTLGPDGAVATMKFHEALEAEFTKVKPHAQR